MVLGLDLGDDRKLPPLRYVKPLFSNLFSPYGNFQLSPSTIVQSCGSSSQGSKDISEVVKKLERHGPGSDRLSAMKAAFRSQYNSQVSVSFRRRCSSKIAEFEITRGIG